jgi:anti-anti-sigma regulatory factor
MFGVHKEKIGDVSVILCKGRMAGGEAALKLRDEVRRQEDTRVVLLDLSELVSLGGDVMGMLVALQLWTRGLGIQFKLFDPPPGVRQDLRRLHSTAEFEIVSIDDVLSLLHWSGPRNGFIESVSKRPGIACCGIHAVAFV